MNIFPKVGPYPPAVARETGFSSRCKKNKKGKHMKKVNVIQYLIYIHTKNIDFIYAV